MNSQATGEIGENVKIARECSLLGNYETALIYYQGVVQQIHRHLQSLNDANLKEKWQEVSVCWLLYLFAFIYIKLIFIFVLGAASNCSRI